MQPMVELSVTVTAGTTDVCISKARERTGTIYISITAKLVLQHVNIYIDLQKCTDVFLTRFVKMNKAEATEQPNHIGESAMRQFGTVVCSAQFSVCSENY